MLEAEHRVYPLALGLVAEGIVRMIDGRCLIEGPVRPKARMVPEADTSGVDVIRTSLLSFWLDCRYFVLSVLIAGMPSLIGLAPMARLFGTIKPPARGPGATGRTRWR